jgi:hypothetical protein
VRSRWHPKLQPEGHIAAQAERHDIAPQQVSKADHVYSTGSSHFVYAGIGEVKLTSTVGADERAMAADVLFALNAAAEHRAIVD